MIIRIFDFFKDISCKNRRIILVFLIFLIITILYVLFRNLIFSIFLTLCLVFVFSETIRAVNEKRLELLHNQLIELSINIIVMIKAGKSVRDIIRKSLEWTRIPLKNYLKHLADELEINTSFDEALDDFAKNCSSREAQLIATALKINNKVGGNLAFILGNIVETLQESFKIKSNARTVTLQSRYSGNIIALMPVIILVLMFFSMNVSINDFFSSRLGNIFLIAGAVLELSGILIIRRILTVKN